MRLLKSSKEEKGGTTTVDGGSDGLKGKGQAEHDANRTSAGTDRVTSSGAGVSGEGKQLSSAEGERERRCE